MQLQWRLYLPVALTIVTLIGALTSSATWSHAGQTIRLITMVLNHLRADIAFLGPNVSAFDPKRTFRPALRSNVCLFSVC